MVSQTRTPIFVTTRGCVVSVWKKVAQNFLKINTSNLIDSIKNKEAKECSKANNLQDMRSISLPCNYIIKNCPPEKSQRITVKMKPVTFLGRENNQY